MADSKEPVETLKFHDFTNENSDDFGVVASDQEEEYDPVRDAKDLPDLYRYLEALNTAESDLDGPHEPPQLFSQPQHKHSRNNIQLLTYEADEERVQEYVSEFEAAAADEILTVGKISLEEIQEEEKRLRDEHISFQQQELALERERQEELLKDEEDAKKRVATDLKALKCYECISTSDPKCEDRSAVEFVFSPPPVVDCAGECAKIVGKVLGNQVITRSCVPICIQTGLNIFGSGASTSCCDTNKCNSAHQSKISVGLLALMSTALVLYKYF